MPKTPHTSTRKAGRAWCLLAAAAVITFAPRPAKAILFTAGDIVVSVYGDGDGSGTYRDNGASPITLDQFTTGGTAAGQLVLAQSTTTTGTITNFPISGEYGSSSEGTLERSANGQYLTIAGYGVAASTFNANPASFGGGTKSCIGQGTCFPLAQTSSVPGFAASAASGAAATITVPRIVALIGANGAVDTSTALTGVYNENNPRSVATVDGASFYLSGQGFNKSDTTTQGVFLAQRGATTATLIDTSFDTRTVEIQNGQLYVSADSTEGSGAHENISKYGSPGNLPSGPATATVLTGLQSKVTTTSAAQLNTLDTGLGGSKIYLSPQNAFFANATTLYVADSGAPKSDNNGTGGAAQGLSDGGLQKWVYNGTAWVLDYTLSSGLMNFVPDTTACGANQVNCGTTGLIGLTGDVVGNSVELFATNATLGDQDQTYLYAITDALSATTGAGEAFGVLATAPADATFRGVAFAPVPEPATWPLLLCGLIGIGLTHWRRVAGRFPLPQA